jgi:hypothetical protein
MKRWLATLFSLLAASAVAQDNFGGLYIAGDAGFAFKQAVQMGLAENRGRFFVLVLPPETRGLSPKAPAAEATLRDRAAKAGAVFLVCKRDVDSGAVSLAGLVPGVVPIRGWPPVGSPGLPLDQLFYPDEDPKNFPTSVTLLRRLRATCSS